ncbi:MAG: hypothetical protein R2749_16350 [Acidimicrobiales bacterium]
MARCTTGGPDGKICDWPFTITVKCDISARPAGQPATEPMMADATGTVASSSANCHHRSPCGRPMWPDSSSALELWPTPSTKCTSGMPYCRASGWMKSCGRLCTSWGEPPEMVKSSPPTATGRPSISPSPWT